MFEMSADGRKVPRHTPDLKLKVELARHVKAVIYDVMSVVSTDEFDDFDNLFHVAVRLLITPYKLL
jgi:hypothetical protein